MNFEDLKDPELQEKLKSVKTPDELVALAREQGMELADDQLEAVSGGSDWYCASVCPSNCNCLGQCIIDTGNPCHLNA